MGFFFLIGINGNLSIFHTKAGSFAGGIFPDRCDETSPYRCMVPFLSLFPGGRGHTVQLSRFVRLAVIASSRISDGPHATVLHFASFSHPSLRTLRLPSGPPITTKPPPPTPRCQIWYDRLPSDQSSRIDPSEYVVREAMNDTKFNQSISVIHQEIIDGCRHYLNVSRMARTSL